MKTTVSVYDFVQAFVDHDRFEHFGRPALMALFEYYEQYEEDTGEEMELDVVAVCCEWTRYDTAHDAALQYGWNATEGLDGDDEIEAACNEWLQGETLIIPVSEYGVLVREF